MPVVVHNEAAWLLPLNTREIAAALCAMLRAAGRPSLAVELFLVRDGRMAEENVRCMGCQGPTNVLSFPGDAELPGEMLLSADALHRECLLYGQPPAEHLLRLLAHGMGHLQGLDHGPEMEALCAHMWQAAVRQQLPVVAVPSPALGCAMPVQ